MTVLLCLVVSCENQLDNYDAPDGGIHGTVYDKQTEEPIPLPVEGNSGAMVSLYEKNVNATESVDFRARQDGTFVNGRVFNGDYRVVVAGPFVGVCEGDVRVSGQTEVALYAIPLSRITTEALIAESNKLTVAYKVDKADESLDLSEIQLLWNITRGVDINTSNYAGKRSMGDEEEGSYVFDLESDKAFIENHYKIRNNGGKLYVRVAATVNGIVNYSKVMEITLNIDG
ncbi:hypothetical protein DN748_17120 [Sinomicrobium soli]|nr:hypothetical protein DN748_17120 [Sinomicrobium sp. N-1-3-6]